MTTTAARPRRAGRPPKVANPFRWQLYVDNESRFRARDRAGGDAELADVMRAFLDAYAAGTVEAPEASA